MCRLSLAPFFTEPWENQAMKFAVGFWATFLLLCAGSALAQRTLSVGPAPMTGQRVALVIGNSAYKESPLANPVNDAADMASVLQDLGFKVILRRNAGTREMRQAIREFGAELRRAEVGLFYFAGHGVQVRGNNYLVPVGADIDNEADVEDLAIDANFAMRVMEEAQVKVSIAILDACRNNPFARGFRSAARGLAQMNAATGSLVAFATAPGSIAADGSGRNGLYTRHLLANLRSGDPDILKVFQRTRSAVVKETAGRQTPWESTSLIGDFYFRPPAHGGEPSTAASAALAASPSADPSGNERALWDAVKESKNPEELRVYLDRFPGGLFALLAQARLRALAATQVATAAPAIAAVRTPRSVMNAALISEVVSQVDKNYIVPPDFAALVRGGARGLERGLLKGKLQVSDDSRGLALTQPAGAGAPYVIDRTASASDAQHQLALIGNLAKEADPSANTSRIEESLLRSALAALDPHSDFLGVEAYKELQVGASGAFGGLGMEVGLRDGRPTVVTPFEGAPAARAGIRAGDRILSVDGFVTADVPLADVVSRVRGAPGSRATLGIQREGWTAPRDFTIVREIIRIESVRSRELETDIGYIQISQFQQATPQRLQEILDAWSGGFLRPARVKGLVLDLRNDPGGLLNTVVEVAGKFLPEGQLVLTTESRLQNARMRLTAKPSGKQLDVPMVVLVNKGSASGTEVLAAALQDWKRATLVGERTFGKGTVQTMLPIAGGYAVKLSTAEFVSPKGRKFTGAGIEPDLVVLADAQAPGSAGAEDAQLQAAVARLKQLITESGRAPGNPLP